MDTPGGAGGRTLLVAPVAAAARLADVCTLARVRGRLVPVEGAGCVLLPEVGQDPGEAAARLSRLVQGADVVVLTVAEDAVTAQRWRAGSRQQDPPSAGLLLSTWPDDVQRLLLGRIDAADVAGTRTAGRGSRWRAAWSLARSRRREG